MFSKLPIQYRSTHAHSAELRRLGGPPDSDTSATTSSSSASGLAVSAAVKTTSRRGGLAAAAAATATTTTSSRRYCYVLSSLRVSRSPRGRERGQGLPLDSRDDSLARGVAVLLDLAVAVGGFSTLLARCSSLGGGGGCLVGWFLSRSSGSRPFLGVDGRSLDWCPPEGMGNCMDTAAAADTNPADPSKGASKTSYSSYPSTTKSGSSWTVPSYKDRSDLPTPRTEGEILSSSNLKAFTLSELKNATKNFKPDSLLGEGGFGYVYKGWIDEQTLAPARPGSGMVVAVKKLKPEGFQGHKEWLTEVDYLGQLHHQNLVKLIGYCSDGDNRLLVYEYMPKGSLENHLFRRGADPLSWGIRLKVAIGAARGLSFLHDAENQVIYRDFKASNILLDSEFNAKLSDFGLAKAGPTGDRTHVSTQVMGTRGYAAPEYVATGRLSVKADVYSFGVVLLELLTGRRALDKSKPASEQNLVDWTRPYLGDKRRLYRIMDMKLGGQYPKKGAHAIATIALQCIRSEAKMRPQMSEVLEKLEQLQDPKYNVASPQVDTRRRSSGSVPRSPMRMQPSPRRLSALASPLPAAGSPLPACRTAQVH